MRDQRGWSPTPSPRAAVRSRPSRRTPRSPGSRSASPPMADPLGRPGPLPCSGGGSPSPTRPRAARPAWSWPASSPTRSTPPGRASWRRSAAEVLALHKTVTSLRDTSGGMQLPWPPLFGTPPWAVARQMETITGVSFDSDLVVSGRGVGVRPDRRGDAGDTGCPSSSATAGCRATSSSPSAWSTTRCASTSRPSGRLVDSAARPSRTRGSVWPAGPAVVTSWSGFGPTPQRILRSYEGLGLQGVELLLRDGARVEQGFGPRDLVGRPRTLPSPPRCGCTRPAVPSCPALPPGAARPCRDRVRSGTRPW